jgi:RimJ/RimL family protein N-acetyltransferase
MRPYAMVQDDGVKRFTYIPSDADERFVTAWIERYERGWEDGSRAGFAVCAVADDAYLGFAAIVRLDLAGREGEIGYMLAPAARGRGAAADALRLLTDWGFETLGLERLELRMDAENAASVRVAERVGYRLEGILRSVYFKEGRRTDTAVFSRLRNDRLPV